MHVGRFQTGDKPWSDYVAPEDYAHEFGSRLKGFKGPFRVREEGGRFGPYRKRSEAVERAARALTGGREGFTVYVANAAGKGARGRVVDAAQPWGKVYPCVGPCRDDYPNMVVAQNQAGQLVKLQEPAMMAYHEAERRNGRAITITGEGWRSCSSQRALYYSDPGRFANPDNSRHCRGLAIDVTNTPGNLTAKARASLVSVGFRFGVSGEPWHTSYLDGG